MVSLGFIITSLIVIVIPGTGVIYTVSAGIAGNRRDCIIAALGCTLGIVPHLIAGILGISAIMHMSARLFLIVRFVGVGYLLYLGYGLIVSKNAFNIDEGQKNGSDLSIIGKGILLNLLNPKLTLFFFSFLPQFISGGGTDSIMCMIVLSLIFMGLTLVVFVLYGLAANGFKRHIAGSSKITERIQRCFGAALISFAAKMAFSDS